MSSDKSPTGDEDGAPWLGRWRRGLGIGAGVLGVLMLGISAAWWWGEGVWGGFTPLSPQQAFTDGSFGLELAPLKYFLVMQQLSAKPMGLEGGKSWRGHFGFLRRPDFNTGQCVKDVPGNLPVGFSVSHRLPGSATPVPVQFVGLTCAACHSTAAGEKGVILGAGTQTADLLGFQDAFLSAVFDPKLSADAILDAYDRQCPDDADGPLTRPVEKFFIGQWLSGFRDVMRLNASKYDLPYHGTETRDPARIPAGPSRTRPFRSVIRGTLDLPGESNLAISKIPTITDQADRPWSEFDGSLGDPKLRSFVAVFASGASIPALNEPQIADNIRKAAMLTQNLGIDPKLPTLFEAFPEYKPPGPERLARGRDIYLQQCSGCHGHPNRDGHWTLPAGEQPSITPLEKIGTDPERITFRYNTMLPIALWASLPARNPEPQRQKIKDIAAQREAEGATAEADWWQQFGEKQFDGWAREFPAGHRLSFEGNLITVNHGFMNAPIPNAWLRAPYLHNGSVPTLRELIGLDRRPVKFCRGDAGYDPDALGVRVKAPTGAKSDICAPDAWFLYDTSMPGNSNQGHNYPPPNSVSTDDLEALLDYLRTI